MKNQIAEFEPKSAKAAQVLRNTVCAARHCGARDNNEMSGDWRKKFEIHVAELADKVKRLEMKGVTKAMLVRQLADKVAELAE